MLVTLPRRRVRAVPPACAGFTTPSTPLGSVRFASPSPRSAPSGLSIQVSPRSYHGHVGDLIKVLARDDFEVVAVDVVIRDAAAAVIEQGPATLAEGHWTYAATAVVATGETVTIEAVAKDRPGHPGSKTVSWTNA